MLILKRSEEPFILVNICIRIVFLLFMFLVRIFVIGMVIVS